MKRRDFLKKTALGSALIFIPGMGYVSCTSNVIEPTGMAPQLSFCSPINLDQDLGGFYVEAINGRDYTPEGLTLDNWRLQMKQTVNGQMIREASMSFADIVTRFPGEEITFFHTFQCVGNAPGGSLISNGYFSGVPLQRYLEAVLNVDWNQANRVYFRAFDGYTTNHTRERIISGNPTPIYLVTRLNGVRFDDMRRGSLQHGFPVRLVVQGMMGMKSPKHILEIEVSDRDEIDGYWESREVRPSTDPGIFWADQPPMRINSRISTPINYQEVSPGSTLSVTGIAVGGVDAVAKMEIGIAPIKNRDQLDGDIVWEEAILDGRPSMEDMPDYDDTNGPYFQEALDRVNGGAWPAPHVWTLWEYSLAVPTAKGQYGLFARATDSAGVMQPFEELTAAENADGNNASHSVIIQVK